MAETATTGHIVAIRGGVVDVAFDTPSPRIYELLRAGGVPLEVSALLASGHVRAIAMAPVRGLALGMEVTATGGPITVTVLRHRRAVFF